MFETISREGLAVDRMHFELNERFFFKHLYLNNAPERSDLYHYRNLSIVWNDFIRSCNSRMHLGTFFSIETLFSHIFSGLQLLDFWCVSDIYQILFSKYRFLTKSGIFVWWLWTDMRIFEDIVVFILRLFTFVIRHSSRMRRIREIKK